MTAQPRLSPSSHSCAHTPTIIFHTIINHDPRLKSADHRIGIILIVNCIAAIRIDPEYIDLTIIAHQLTQLFLHSFNINIVTLRMTTIRIVPVAGSVIPSQFYSMFMGSIGNLFTDVFTVSRIHNVVVGCFCIPKHKSVNMFSGQYDVFHPRFFNSPHPLVSVKVNRVEFLIQIVIHIAIDH